MDKYKSTLVITKQLSKLKLDKTATHFPEGHCTATQCLQKVPLSIQAYAANDKLSAAASGFYLQSKWLA